VFRLQSPSRARNVPPAALRLHGPRGIDDEVTLRRQTARGFLKFQLRPAAPQRCGGKRIGNMNALRRRFAASAAPVTRDIRYQTRTRSAAGARMPQCTSATFLRVERARPGWSDMLGQTRPPAVNRPVDRARNQQRMPPFATPARRRPPRPRADPIRTRRPPDPGGARPGLCPELFRNGVERRQSEALRMGTSGPDRIVALGIWRPAGEARHPAF